jgi:hypothetical protein
MSTGKYLAAGRIHANGSGHICLEMTRMNCLTPCLARRGLIVKTALIVASSELCEAPGPMKYIQDFSHQYS